MYNMHEAGSLRYKLATQHKLTAEVHCFIIDSEPPNFLASGKCILIMCSFSNFSNRGVGGSGEQTEGLKLELCNAMQ